MELKYAAVLYIGMIVAGIVLILSFAYKHKGKKLEKAVKLANTDLYKEEKYYRSEMIKYALLRVILVLSLAGSIICAAILLARPYYIKSIKEQKYNRDIILCMDISSSVDELNLKLVKELQNTVKSLSGERVGIVIFNTSSIVLSPLTDDYEYTLKQLENVYEAIKSNNKSTHINDNWMYWNQFLYSGTLVGSDERGSSLIADGLMGGLFAFPEGDDRTKVIIFSTDNEANGESYLSLSEACDYCKRNDVTVYGIGTRAMYKPDMEEMESAVKITGGKFFLEEDSASFHKIVEEIERKSADLIEGKTIIKLIETPEKYFALLVILVILFTAASIILRRTNGWWIACQVATMLLLVGTYIFAVRPAHLYSMGPDMKVKKDSNLNVLFVVDNTISMVASDMDEGQTRLDRVSEDVKYITDELEGARFSLISFNNEAKVLVPFCESGDHIVGMTESLYPVESVYSYGTALGTPLSLMKEYLVAEESGENQGENSSDTKGRKTIVFFLSDGEITKSGEGAPDYSSIAPYVNGGAVLGYGTREGGEMLLKNAWTGEYEQVMDYSEYPISPGVSVIDEDNLKSIAKDMDIEYINMCDRSEIDGILNDLKKDIKITDKKEATDADTGTEYVNPPEYYGFWLLIPLMMLLLVNAGYVIVRK